MMPRADSRAPTLTGLFPGAGAPRFFLAGLGQQLAGLAAWRRGAAWIPELLAQRPILFDAPLFGTTLAAAVQGGQERAETASPQTAAAPPPLPAAPERWRSRSAAAAQPRGEPAARGRAENVGVWTRGTNLRLPTASERAPLPGRTRTQAERSLLATLAGDIPAGPPAVRQRPGLAFAQGAGRGRHLPIAAESGCFIQNLTTRLLSRAFVAGSGAEAAGTDFRGAISTEVSALGLTGQWALPLAGQGVSQEFLEFVQQSFRTPSVAPLPKREGQSSAAEPPGRQGRGSKAPGQGAGQQRRTLALPPALAAAGPRSSDQSFAGESLPGSVWRPPGEAVPLRSPLQRGAAPAESAEPGAGLHSPDATGAAPGPQRHPFSAVQSIDASDEEVAPASWHDPEKTPGARFFDSLRSPRPSQQGDFERSVSVSRRPLRPSREDEFDRGALTAPGAAADDLDDLTEKLQRILEEQARRHGIDV